MAHTNIEIHHVGRVTEHRVVSERQRRFQGEGDKALTLGGDGGYAMALTAMMIIPIMIFLALSVDLGAWYAQGSRQQRAADAASMAGVVWLPDSAKAAQEANRVAQANGFSTGVTPSTVPGNSNQYKVTIVKQAPRYFSTVFQNTAFNMTRTATAAFNKPIPMGSPTNKMGNDIDPTNCPGWQPVSTAPCGPQPLLWSAQNGPYANIEDGDPYSTRCTVGGGSGASCTQTNPLYRDSGFEFAIDVGAADVGIPLTIQGYDMVSVGRTQGTSNPCTSSCGSNPTAPAGTLEFNFARELQITTTAGSKNFTVTGGTPLLSTALGAQDVTNRISDVSGAPDAIPANAYIQTITSSTTGTLSANATLSGSRMVTVGLYDCNSGRLPFSSISGLTTSQCQTGDSGNGQNTDVQLYENDGSDLTIDVSTKLSCHWTQLASDVWTWGGVGTLKNKWTDICTFTPTKTGIYPMFVRNSGFATNPGLGGFNPADNNNRGYNAFALKVTGGTATRLYSLDDMSIWTNSASGIARFYLAEIKPEHKGKTLNIDLYDPGDGGGSSNYVMQVLAPQAGSPATVPTTGTVIPATNFASSCQYNATKSAAKGGGTLSNAAQCQVTTHTSGNNIYNGGWLRVQVKISPTYDCGTATVPDCWWTIKYDFGTGGLPTDRTVWSISVVGDPVHLVN